MNDRDAGSKLKKGINISIIGEPNAGKSSLLNYISGEEVAIVSDIAGTTRDILHKSLYISGIPVTFYDTAGIRLTSDKIENEGVNRAIKNAGEADLKILLIEPYNLNINQKILDIVDGDTLIVVYDFNKYNCKSCLKITIDNFQLILELLCNIPFK